MSRARALVAGWVLAVVAIASFTSLGFWQSRRAIEKQAMPFLSNGRFQG